MRKKATAKLASLTVMAILSAILLPLFFPTAIGQVEEPNITYTETSRTSCLNGTCTMALHSNARYAQNSTGGWIDAGDVFRITRQSDDITFHYDGLKGYMNMTFEAGVFYNGNYYSFADIKAIKPAITWSFPKESYPTHKKYAINFSNLQTINKNKVENITLTYKDHYGFNLNQLKKQSGKMIAKDVMKLAFDDLKESGFTVNISIPERRIYIGNITSDKFDGDTLFLDPSIELTTPDSENLEDAEIRPGNSNEERGAYSNLWVNEQTVDARVMMKWNISSIPASQQIDEAIISLQTSTQYLESPKWQVVQFFFVHDNFTVDGQEWIEGNTTGLTFVLADDGELTYDDSPTATYMHNTVLGSRNYSYLDSGATYYNITITDIIQMGYDEGSGNVSYYANISSKGGGAGYDPIAWRSKEASGVEPILYITYSAAAAGDTCDTCTIDCTEDCTVDAALDCSGATLTMYGSGNILISSEIKNFDKAYIRGGCKVRCEGDWCLI